ncbi:hypothetical protein D3C76_1598620 [compost metagenome]
MLRIGFRESDVIGRLEGATFVALLTGSGSVDLTAIKARFEEMLDERKATGRRGFDIRFSIDQIEYDPTEHDGIEELLAEAEKVMGR